MNAILQIGEVHFLAEADKVVAVARLLADMEHVMVGYGIEEGDTAPERGIVLSHEGECDHQIRFFPLVPEVKKRKLALVPKPTKPGKQKPKPSLN